MFTSLIEQVATVVSLSEYEISQICNSLEVRYLKKGAKLVEDGQLCKHLAFINKGYYRVYISGESKKVTVHLAGPGEFVSSFSAFINQSKSVENVEAITDSEIFLITYENLQSLYQTSHSLEKFGRLMVEKHFVQKENRVISLITDSAEVRYKNLMASRPDFFLNIPLQYVASYLAITSETLSRLRNRIN